MHHLRSAGGTCTTISIQVTHHQRSDGRPTLRCVGHGFQASFGGLAIFVGTNAKQFMSFKFWG